MVLSEAEFLTEELVYKSPDGVPDGSKGGKKLLDVFGVDGFNIKIPYPSEKHDNQFLKSAGVNAHDIAPFFYFLKLYIFA